MTADTPHLDVILSQAPIISVGHDGRSADLGKAEAELSALKARAEAAESAAYAVCREIADEEGRDCGCSKRIMDRIDAALQAAREA